MDLRLNRSPVYPTARTPGKPSTLLTLKRGEEPVRSWGSQEQRVPTKLATLSFRANYKDRRDAGTCPADP